MTTWLLIVTLFLCGGNAGALLHARTGLPTGRPFWPGLLVSASLAAMTAVQLGGASRIARITVALVAILCCAFALILHARARIRPGAA